MGSLFSCAQQPVRSPIQSVSDDLITHMSMDDVIPERGENWGESSDVTDLNYLTPKKQITKIRAKVARHELRSLLGAAQPDRRLAAINGDFPIKLSDKRIVIARADRFAASSDRVAHFDQL